jgi:UDP-N-acetylglucosamine acyltransferase
MSVVMIDPSARVEATAVIGPNVAIGPFCTVGPHVILGEGCRLLAHVNVTGHTTIGPRTVIHPFASLGSPPQSVRYRGGPTKLVVGADCDIRENVTMSLGTEDGGGITEVGDKCFFMVGAHVGHDCKVGSNVTVANSVLLAGHVTVGDNVVFGGGVAVRQFVRIGEGAMIVGMSGVRADVIPFGMVLGSPLGDLVGLNIIGMRRHSFSNADIHRLRALYEELFFGPGEFRARLEKAAKQSSESLARKVIDFIQAGKRPLTMAVKRADLEENA